jgi:hypothetical protein
MSFNIATIIDFVSKDTSVATRFTLEILTQHIEYIKMNKTDAESKRAIDEIKLLKYVVKNSMSSASEILSEILKQITGEQTEIQENPVDNVVNYINTLLSLGESIPHNTPPSIIHQWNTTNQLPEYSPYLYRSYPIDPITRRSIKPHRIDWDEEFNMESDDDNYNNELIPTADEFVTLVENGNIDELYTQEEQRAIYSHLQSKFN